MHFADGKKEIDSDALLKRAGEYRGSIFSRKHFFFSEKMDLADDKVYVKCRIVDDKKYKNFSIPSIRTYHAEFSIKRDEKEGFCVEIYTDEEWEKKLTMSSEDTRAVKRYLEHNREVDEFIEKRIEEKNFTEFIGRAKDLGWDEESPDRTRPKKEYLLPKRVWEYIKGEGVEDLLNGFGTNSDKALKGKNIVFIRVPSYVSFPVIREAGQEISVTTHASRNAVYVFLEEEAFDDLYNLPARGPRGDKVLDEYLKIRETIRGKVIKRLLHAIGKAHNLEIFCNEEKREIQNVMDVAWDEFQEVEKVFLSYVDVDDEVLISLGGMFKGHAKYLMEQYPDLKKLKDGPVNLGTNLRTRVYGGGYVSKKDIAKFLDSQTFSEDELEWIIDLYEEKDWYSGQWDERKSILKRLKCAIAIVEPKKKLSTHPNLWPKLDNIGGIQTLCTALSLKQASINYPDWKKKEADLSPLPPSELKRVALLERDMKSILSEKFEMNEKLLLPTKAVDFYERRLEIIYGMRKLNRVKMRRKPSVFKSQPYDNVFDFSGITLKTLTEKDPILIPCSSCMANGKYKKYGILLDFSVSEKKIIVTALTEEEAIAVESSKKYIKNFKRNAEDRRVMNSYLEHEDKIDAVIDLAFKENRYMSIRTEKSGILDKVVTELTDLFHAINGEKDKKHYEKLARKIVGEAYTLINIGDVSNLPQISIKLTNGNRETIVVRMHTGPQGKYIFFTNDEFNGFCELNDKISTEVLRRDIKRWIVHDAGGVSLGLPATQVGSDKQVINDLDCVYWNWMNSREEEKDFVYDETSYPTIKRILAADNPIMDIEDLTGRNKAGDPYYRDFAAWNLENAFRKITFKSFREAKQKEKTKEFIQKTGSFSTNELKRLVDVYGNQMLYEEVLVNFKNGIECEKYNEYQAVLVKLRAVLKKMGINVKIISHQDLRPRIDKIGGVETFKEALNLRQAMEKLINEKTWDVDKKEAEFNSLPSEELKTVALFEEKIKTFILNVALDMSLIFSDKEESLERMLFSFGKDFTEISEKHDRVSQLKRKLEKRDANLIRDLSLLIKSKHIRPFLIKELFELNEKTIKSSYGENIIDFPKSKLGPQGMSLYIPCFRNRIDGEKDKEYYALVDFSRTGGMDVRLLTQDEAELLRKMNEYGIINHLKRSAEDQRLIDEYSLHETRIDKLVDDVFKSNKVYKIPEDSGFIDDVIGEITYIFHKITGTKGSAYEDLAKKIISSPYTLINVGAESNLPQMPVKIKGKTEEATVRMHTGPLGKYIFLTDKEFWSFYRYGNNVLANEVEQKIKDWMIHDAGEVSLGLSVIGVEDGNIMNELDYASRGLDLDGKPIDKDIGYSRKGVKSEISEIYAKTFPTLKKILNAKEPIVNIHDLKGKNAAGESYTRGYTAGNIWERIETSENIFELETFLKISKIGNLGDLVEYSSKEADTISKVDPDIDVKSIQQKLNHGQDPSRVEQQIKKRISDLNIKNKMKTISKQTGITCSPPETNFTLFVLNDFVAGSANDDTSEYGQDRIDYGSRCGIERIKTDIPDRIVDSILFDIKKLGLKSQNVVVQLPSIFAEEKGKYVSKIEKLKEKAPGIRFIIVDTAGIKNEGTLAERKNYRKRIYSIMRLVGKMGRCGEMHDDVQVMEFLKYLMGPFLKNVFGQKVQAEVYVALLQSGKIQGIANVILSCVPVVPLPDPNYDEYVEIFTSA